MAYATVEQVEAGFRPLTSEETPICSQLLDEAATMIDSTSTAAADDVKGLVSCRMVRRAIDAAGGSGSVPMGATQGSVAALGYSQSWTIGTSGSTGELYFSRAERQLLRLGNQIGAGNPLMEAAHD